MPDRSSPCFSKSSLRPSFLLVCRTALHFLAGVCGPWNLETKGVFLTNDCLLPLCYYCFDDPSGTVLRGLSGL